MKVFVVELVYNIWYKLPSRVIRMYPTLEEAKSFVNNTQISFGYFNIIEADYNRE